MGYTSLCAVSVMSMPYPVATLREEVFFAAKDVVWKAETTQLVVNRAAAKVRLFSFMFVLLFPWIEIDETTSKKEVKIYERIV
jgi:hypothetical protein